MRLLRTFAAGQKNQLVLKLVGLVGVAVLCATLTQGAVDHLSLLTRINQFVQDWEVASVFAPKQAQDPAIIIVAIDEPTLQQFTYRSPVDRKFVSDLLQQLQSHSPAAIGLDLLLDQPTEAAKDAALRSTLAGMKVPLIVSYIQSAQTLTADQQSFEDAMVPMRQRGLADLPTDQFDTARSVFPGARLADGKYLLGFARALAAAVGVQTPAVEVPIIWRGQPPPTSTDHDPKPFRQISALVARLMPDSWFRNKIVLIGSDVTLVDRHRTPFSAIIPGDAGQLPGVVIQAHSLSQLLNGRKSPMVDWPIDFAITLSFALLGAALGMSHAQLLTRIFVAALLVMVLWGAGISLFHSADIMIGLFAPALALIAAFGVQDSLGGREARRQREFIQGAFSRYVSPKVVEQMVRDPSRMSLEGDRRLMTYLFSDIQDFTTLSEKMDSRDLARLLNGYLDGMTEIVMKHDGMVDKFIGDAVFAIFNAPIDLPDHAQKAVHCMLALDDFTERFRKAQSDAGHPLGVTRIGVHTGVSVIGNFGSQARFTYTAQGDAVNTAARLEGINKYFGTRLCVSDATRLLCPDIAFRPVASVVLKGKTEAIDLWEPLHARVYAPEFMEAYAYAYDHLKEQRADAADLFADLLAAHPNDPCVALHVNRLHRGAVGVKMVMTDK
jgi:adenylate cyclase